MTTPIVIANWKMQLSLARASTEARAIAEDTKGARGTIVLCPSYHCLTVIKDEIAGSDVRLGAQDAFARDWGAYTGAVSAAMLEDVGCQFVIVGHSERRQYFAETNESTREKCAAVLRHNMTPILCVGETGDDRTSGRGETVVREQLTVVLQDLPELSQPLIIAYEPVWAIGNGEPAASDEVQKMKVIIQEQLKEIVPPQLHLLIPIIYGGSVSPASVAEYVGPDKMQGVLVGTDSLNTNLFLDIVKVAQSVS